jgi:exodeoxyribonuclease VII large subunit
MRIDALAATALAALMRTVQTRRAALVQATGRLDRQAPDFPEQRRRVDGLATRSTAALDRCLREARQAVAGCGWRLRSLDPLATLARGFAIVQRDGRALVSARDVRPGDALDVRLRDGRFAATAGRVERRRGRGAARDGQQPLFEMPPTERLPL